MPAAEKLEQVKNKFGIKKPLGVLSSILFDELGPRHQCSECNHQSNLQKISNATNPKKESQQRGALHIKQYFVSSYARVLWVLGVLMSKAASPASGECNQANCHPSLRATHETESLRKSLYGLQQTNWSFLFFFTSQLVDSINAFKHERLILPQQSGRCAAMHSGLGCRRWHLCLLCTSEEAAADL